MLPLSALFLASAIAAKPPPYKPRGFENLVTFGDSYTDESRLAYFGSHNGEAPPVGMLMPENNASASGGYPWGRIVAQKTGAMYYNYAVSGATCSNEIIEREWATIHAPFPSVMDYEIPAFKADVKYVNETTGTNTLYTNRRAENTVYALWIGTNDLGFGAFLSDSQAPGTTISTFVDCIWEVFDNIYETGGRRFVLLNQAPLEVSPLYAEPDKGGTFDSKFWTNKTLYNMTEYNYKMLEYTTNVNTLFDYGVPFQLLIQRRWPDASFAIFNVHQLLRDIHNKPEAYLEAPANVTGSYYTCDGERFSHCVKSKNDMASFMWYDELHPSERSDEIIAENFIDVVNGNSTYGTYY